MTTRVVTGVSSAPLGPVTRDGSREPSSVAAARPIAVFFMFLAVVPGSALLAISGHLQIAMQALAVASLCGGALVFLSHGGWRITAAGSYCLAAGLMAGSGGWYWAATQPLSTTRASVFLAALSIYASTAFMYILFWHGRGVPSTSVGPELLSPDKARNLGLTGIALFLAGAVAQKVSLGTLPTACADMGVAAFAASLLLSGRARVLGSARILLVSLAMLAYYLVVFTGGGRLRLVALAITIAIMAQFRSKWRVKALAMAALIPGLLVLGIIGQLRLSAEHPNAVASASGLGSLVNPLATYGQIIHGHVSGDHGKSYVAEPLVLLPRSLWPHKPVQVGRTLALRLDPNVAEVTNLSVAVMPQAEAYFNFSWLGILLVIPLIGLVVLWLDERLVRRVEVGIGRATSLLGFLALSVVIGSLTDLAWGGTATWAVRDIQRLLVLAPFAFLAWISTRAAASPSGAYRDRHSFAAQAAARGAVSSRASVQERGIAWRTTKVKTPVTSRPVPTASVWETVDAEFGGISSFGSLRRTADRAMAFVVDEGLSSLQNFAVVFAALRYLSISTLGVFTIVYNAGLLVETMLRSLMLAPLTIRYSHLAAHDQRQAGARAAGSSVLAGAGCALLAVVVSLAFHGGHRTMIMALGFATLALIAQEVWRVFFFPPRNPPRDVTNNAVCLSCTVGLLVLVVAKGGRPSAAILLIVWGTGTGCGAILGAAQTGIMPKVRSTRSWLSEHWSLGSRLAGAQSVERLATQSAFALTAVVAGSVALGQISAARTLISPFTTLIVAVGTFATPEAARLYRRGSPSFRVFTPAVSLILTAGVAAFGVAIFVLPDSVGKGLAGTNWVEAKAQLLPILVWTGSNALRSGALNGLQVMERSREVLRFSLVTGLSMVCAVPVGAAVDGARGAAWGFALVSAATAVVYWAVFIRLGRTLNRPVESRSTIGGS
jgi:O-antigen/teichoic acid export membrane protein